MTNPDHDRLVELLKALDATQNRNSILRNYFDGNSPLSYLSAEAKAALEKFDRLSSNLCRTAVVSLAERLRISGFSGKHGATAWDAFIGSDLDQLSANAHRDSLLYGWTAILVWVDGNGRPRATIESPRNVAVLRDPVTRQITAAVKRVTAQKTTDVWVYLADEVQHWHGNRSGATAEALSLVKTVPNPLGVPPVAVIGDESETSVIADLMPLQDALNKLLTDAMVASEFSGRPRRWATGIEAVEDAVIDEDGNPVTGEDGEPITTEVNPFPEANRMMLSDNDEAKFGQLAGADLSGFEAGVKIIISQAMMVSGLPAHYVGLLQDSVTSADALRAAEAALVARAEAFQRLYGVGWELVARLLVALSSGVDSSDVDVRIGWSPADTRSTAQEVDAAVKLWQTGLMSRRTILKRLGLTDDEIAAEVAEYQRDAADARDLAVGRYLAGTADR